MTVEIAGLTVLGIDAAMQHSRRKQKTLNQEHVKKETFQLIAPEAEEVLLLGDFTNWEENPILLRHQNDGIWKISLPLEPGRHEYRFIVDGQWCDDVRSTHHIPNPFGGQNCVREVVP